MCKTPIERAWEAGYTDGYEQGHKDATAKSIVGSPSASDNKHKRKPCPNWKKGTTCYLCECDWWKGTEFECGTKRCDLSVLGTASAVR